MYFILRCESCGHHWNIEVVHSFNSTFCPECKSSVFSVIDAIDNKSIDNNIIDKL